MAITFALRIAYLVWFVLLCYIGARLIDPAKFISLETTQHFAEWMDGNVSQENFDDLWVLAWVICSLAFAMVGYIATIRIIRKIRR